MRWGWRRHLSISRSKKRGMSGRACKEGDPKGKERTTSALERGENENDILIPMEE